MTTLPHEWLLISHPTPALSVIDAHTFAIIDTLPLRGRVAVLEKSQSGKYGFVMHRDDHLITIIRAGDSPSILREIGTGQEPTHFHAHGDQIVVFNDGDGSVAIFDEAHLEEPSIPEIVKVTQPDHGSAVVLGDFVLAGFLRLGRVDVYQRGHPDMLMTFDCCKGLHGATQIGDTALFGCTDGVLIVKREADELRRVKLDNPPGTPMRVRVGLFATHPKQRVALGNFGHGLAIIDPDEEKMDVLPLAAAPLKFAFDSTGNDILALTADGKLQQIDTTTQEIKRVIEVTARVPETKGPGGPPRPSFAVGAASVFITSPDEKCLTEVDLATFTISRTANFSDDIGAIVCLHG